MYSVAEFRFSFSIYVTSSAIQIYSIFRIFRRQHQPYSLEKIFYIFVFFFFGIAPLLQYYENISFWGAKSLTEGQYIFMNILILFVLFIYSQTYSFFITKSISKRYLKFSKKFKIRPTFKISTNLILIAISLLSFLVIFYANNFSLISMLVRSGEFRESNIETKSSGLIIFRFFQPLSISCLYYYLFSKSKNYVVLFILVILALITCAPTGMARFSAAALYIPLLILAIPWFEKKNVFSLMLVFGMLIFFPFLNQFRKFDPEEKLNVGFDFSMFTAGHFDAYNNFTLIVSHDIITYGNQLVGVFLFFFPRALWPNKPIGSGAFIADQVNLYFSNISVNFFAEGYINFGYLGIILFVIILAVFSAKFDKLYWGLIAKEKNNFFKVFYLIMLGMLFFILRGDLMSAFAYTLGFLTSAYTVFRIVTK